MAEWPGAGTIDDTFALPDWLEREVISPPAERFCASAAVQLALAAQWPVVITDDG